MKNRIVEAAIIAVSIIALGLCIYGATAHVMNSQRYVTVKGLATMEVPANVVTWPISYSENGNDLAQLADQVNTVNAQIVTFLTENGIDAADITVAPPTLQDNYSNYYTERKPEFRYEITSVVTVCSENIEKVRELINRQGELIRQGIAINSWGVQYDYTELNDIKPQMIQEATENARQAAEKFAEDSKSKVGKIKTATQGQFSIENRDENSPNIKSIRVVTSVVYYLD